MKLDCPLRRTMIEIIHKSTVATDARGGEIHKLENEERRPKPTGIRSFVSSGIGSKIG